MRRQLAISFVILTIMVMATILVILYGKGYRFGFDQGAPAVSGTGLLVATSSPDGAQVFINGHLTTATDNTINLSPGEYDVKIFKQGYFPWEKKIDVQKEVVSKADALLLPTAPKLESITNIGVLNPVMDPAGTKIAYMVASQSAIKNGIYILDMSLRPVLTLQSASTQIANNTSVPFSQSMVSWSADGKQLLAKIASISTTYLLNANSSNPNPTDVTETIASVNATWEKLKQEKDNAQLDSLKRPLRTMVIQSFDILEWSDDETKILYVASQSATLPEIIKPPIIGANSTPQTRDIEKDAVYVYDIKEDRNYKILNNLPSVEEGAPNPIMWFPDSKHLIYVHNAKIDIMEYDGANSTTIYAGPFVDHYVFPWPDATRVVILTNLGNPSITPNLYTISLK